MPWWIRKERRGGSPYHGPVSETAGWRPLQKPARAAARVTGVGPTPFSKLAVAHLLSTGGDALVTLALAGSLFFNISPNEARGKVVLSLVLTMAPFAVVAPFLGPAIDRVQGGRRFMVMGAMFGRTMACFAMARYVHTLLLFPAAFFALVLSKAYGVAKAALVPAVVESDDELVQANSKLTVGGALVGVAAALPGVALLKLFNARAVLWFAAAVFFVGGVMAARIVPSREDRKAAAPDQDTHVASRNIVLTAGVMAVLRGSVGFLTFLLAFNLRRSHAPAYWYGLVLLASVGGGLVGAAVAPKLRSLIKEETIVISALVAVAAGGFAAYSLTGRGAAALLAAVVGLASGAGKLAFDSLVQRDAPEAARGRAFAKFEAGFQLAWVIGALVPVVITMSAEIGFLVLSIVAGGCAIAYAVARLRPPAAKPVSTAVVVAAPEPQP